MKPSIMITSDGTGWGTVITDGDGKRIPGVTRIVWDISANDESRLILEFGYPVQISLTGEPKLIKMAKWSYKWPFYLTADVHPVFFGHYYAKGYKVIGYVK
jgi:hypothetical protein